MIKRLLAILAVTFFLWSCAGEDGGSAAKGGAQPKPAKTQKAAGKDAEVKSAEVEPVEKYAYAPSGKRDPFESPLRKGQYDLGEIDVPLTPLQQYEISQLRLTGVVVGFQNPKAMVKAPDGKAYILNIGTLVGKNGGKVVKINNEGVLVEEILRDFSGETRVNSVLIALPKRKGV